jgi:hypothetical protein
MPGVEVMAMSENPEGHAPHANPEKGTSEWVTGDEPMTGAQHSYLHALAQEAKSQVPQGQTGAQPSDLIDELQQQTGRGTDRVIPHGGVITKSVPTQSVRAEVGR